MSSQPGMGIPLRGNSSQFGEVLVSLPMPDRSLSGWLLKALLFNLKVYSFLWWPSGARALDYSGG